MVTDLDGTLLRSDATLSDYTVDVVRQALRSGIPVTYATARSYQTASPLVARLPLSLPAIVYNGAFVVAADTGTHMVANWLDGGIAAQVLSEARRYGVVPFTLGFTGGREVLLHSAPQNAGQRSFLKKRHGDPRLIAVRNVQLPEQVIELLFAAPRGDLTGLFDWVESRLAGLVSVSLTRDVYCDGCYQLEIYHPHANKRDMLRWIARHLGVALSTVTVFGDGENDLPMFEIAGRRVAVANAHPEVLRHADHVVASNDNDGVARYIESL